MRRLCIFLSAVSLLCLTACDRTPVEPPSIDFIGIATGSLTTDLNALKFRNSFKKEETQLVGIVGFSHIDAGSTAQATWYSPDERTPPIGRSSAITQPGARTARFSFASGDGPWTSNSYKLRVDITTGHGIRKQTATGSLFFYIDKSDSEIRAYQEEYRAWLKDMKK